MRSLRGPADSGHHRRNSTGEVIHPVCPHAPGQPPRGHLPGPPPTSASMLARKQPSRDFSTLACGSLLTSPRMSGETLNSLTLPQHGAGLFSKQVTDSISESPPGGLPAKDLHPPHTRLRSRASGYQAGDHLNGRRRDREPSASPLTSLPSLPCNEELTTPHPMAHTGSLCFSAHQGSSQKKDPVTNTELKLRLPPPHA